MECDPRSWKEEQAGSFGILRPTERKLVSHKKLYYYRTSFAFLDFR